MAVDVDGTNALLARAARSAIVGPTNATSHCRKCNVATEGRDDYHAQGRGGRVPPTAPWLRGLVAPRLQRTRTAVRSEEHTSELQSRLHLVCRLLLEKKKKHTIR